MARIVAAHPRALGDFFIPVSREYVPPAFAAPQFDPYELHEHTSGPLPESSPHGEPWLLWTGSPSNIERSGPGLDAAGNWWLSTGSYDQINELGGRRPAGTRPEWTEPGTIFGAPLGDYWSHGWRKVEGGPDFLDQVATVTREFVLPAIAFAVGTAVGGVGGIVAAALIGAVTKIAKGARVSDALVSTARDTLPTLASATIFNKTIATAKAYGLEKMVDFGKTMTAEDRMAFDQARILATAYVTQEKSLAELKAKLPDKAALIEAAAANMGTPIDIALALGGERAKAWMNEALVRNAATSDATAPMFLVAARVVATADAVLERVAGLPTSLQAQAIARPAETPAARIAIGVGTAGAVGLLGWLAKVAIRRMF